MQTQPYLTSLTPLRGIAAIIVLIFHCDLFLDPGNGILINHNDSQIIAKGYLMVDFFFVLSGFIMSYVYFNSFHTGFNASAFKKFILARFARIYPLHLFTFLWVIVLHFTAVAMGTYKEDWLGALSNNYWAIPSQLLLLQGMHLHNWTTWNGPSWSISVEWWMYLLFPAVIMMIVRMKSFAKLITFLVLWAGIWWIVLYIKPNNPLPLPFPIPTQYTIDVTADFGFLRCFFQFSLGVLFYQLYREQWLFKWISRSYFFIAMVVVMFLCMHFAVLDAFTVLTFPLIILSAAYNQTSVKSFFAVRPLQYLGDLSFSIYMIHFPIFITLLPHVLNLVSVRQPMSSYVGWIICFGWTIITILFSALTYRYLEVPARKWINGWSRFNSKQVSTTEFAMNK